jgi:multicomponent Na+:H+ antiporter subunit G
MTMLLEVFSGIFMFLGAFLILVASIGIYRMPDIYMRLAASSKAATLGAACVLIALAIHFFTVGIAARALATILFLFLTAPIAAHMIGRAAYITGCPLWQGTVLDELKGRYDTKTHVLASPAADKQPKTASRRQAR